MFLVLATAEDDKPMLTCYISRELVTSKNLNAGSVVRELGKYIQGGGGGQQLDPAARAAMMKERYKALGCNDVQVDSVIAITNDFRPKMMALRDLDQDARAEKMKEINDESLK